MPSYCFLCSNNYLDKRDLSYFRFPKEENRCSLWFDLIGRVREPKYTTEYCYNNLRLCADHFQESQFSNRKRTRLYLDALPTRVIAANPFLEVKRENETVKHLVIKDELNFGNYDLKDENTDMENYNRIKGKCELPSNVDDNFKEQHASSNMFPSIFIKEEVVENDLYSLGSEPSNSENPSISVKSENNIKYETDEITDDESVIKREEIHIKTEDDYSRKMGRNRNLENDIPKSCEDSITFKCDRCSFQTKHKYSLKRHALTHKSSKASTMFKCDTCSFQTRHGNSLERHAITHKSFEESITFKCDKCSFQTIHKFSLKGHALTHKDSEELTKFKCHQCPFQTVYKSHLKRHAIVHSGLKKLSLFQCVKCSFQTIHKECLKTHLITHKSSVESTLFKCDECSFHTIHKRSLRRHALTHSSE